MDRQAGARIDLECMLLDETKEPKALPLSLLENITKNFSPGHKIGSGGFAVVYKGVLDNGTVAVKKLSNTYLYEDKFRQEIECLMKAKHKNIVRFLGYCSDTQEKFLEHEGKAIMAGIQERILCFEYVPKGDLLKYISDASSGLEWRDRYKIIKGICEGLNYLHTQNIVHLDLKPANILMDDKMVPKITDFGVSRCFKDDQTHTIVTRVAGTPGYLAPEFTNGIITFKYDVYALGVIIMEILTGAKGYHEPGEIWDMEEKACVHTMEAFMSPVISVIAFPGSPYLITGSRDGSVYFWSSSEFSEFCKVPRLERIVNFGSAGAIWGFGRFMGSRRIVIGQEYTVSIMAIDTEEEPFASEESNEKSI